MVESQVRARNTTAGAPTRKAKNNRELLERILERLDAIEERLDSNDQRILNEVRRRKSGWW